MCACEGSNATSTVSIAYNSSVDGCLADEAIATVDGQRVWVLGVDPANHETLVYDGLIANEMGLQELGGSAVGRTAKC